MCLIMNSKKNALLIKVGGDFDLVSASVFREKIDKSLDETMCKHLLIDLSRVKFIDSSGLGVILGRYKKIKGNNGVMVIYGANPAVEKILGISGIVPLINVCRSEEEAWKIIDKTEVKEV
ncbi:MAG: anti-sigma factor antagonist [Clostridia bacterium]|nr:anti-sigma factor antagonist [Clostridia bacterium]MDD4047679.1 anti-sigma factor antagonist [Clostridia bacterium]